MNSTIVRAVQCFVHGSYSMARNDVRELPASVANDLAAAGLVETVVEKRVDSARAAELAAEAAQQDALTAAESEAEAAAEPEAKAAPALANKALKPLVNKGK